MQLLIYGPGRLGGAIAAAAVAAGWPTPGLVGRPDPAGRRADASRVDVVVDASAGASVAANLAHALDAGNRAFVLATTGWDADIALVRSLLLEHGAAAVVAPNLSLGAALFARLVETAAGWYARAGGFEPSIVEWHRRGKADRPSGTARALARRIATADPRWAVDGEPDDARPVLEVAGIRAGAAPGTHLVTFDGAGRVGGAAAHRPRPVRVRRRRPRRRPMARRGASRARPPPVRRRGRRPPGARRRPRLIHPTPNPTPDPKEPLRCPRPSASAAPSPPS